MKHLEWITVILAAVLLMTSLFSFLYVYFHGKELLNTASDGERNEICVEPEEENTRRYAADIPTVLVTADGMEFMQGSRVDEPFYNLVGHPAGHKTRYLADLYHNQVLVEEVYSPLTGLWVREDLPEKQIIPLTIRADLQERLYHLFLEQGKTGTAYVYDYESGDILSCVSVPGCSSDTPMDELPEGSLINRALYAVPPGSTMKVLTVMLLEEQTDLDALCYTCTGSYTLPDGGTITCHHVHGEVDTELAMGVSCNAFFAQAIVEHLQPQTMAKSLRDLGWNVNGTGSATFKVSGIPMTCSSISLEGQDWTFTNVWCLIGETEVLVSPAQLTRLAASYLVDRPALPRFRTDEKTSRDKLFTPDPQAREVWKAGLSI